MAMDWFRSWHNAPTDPKWLLIARKANVPPGMVSAVFWALLDHASQEKERGCVAGFDVETYAGWAGWDEDEVQAIIDAMRSKGVITEDNRLASWEKRQPKQEDPGAAERMRKMRDAKRNATVTQDESVTDDTVTDGYAVLHNVTLDKIREEKKRPEETREEPQRTSDFPPGFDEFERIFRGNLLTTLQERDPGQRFQNGFSLADTSKAALLQVMSSGPVLSSKAIDWALDQWEQAKPNERFEAYNIGCVNWMLATIKNGYKPGQATTTKRGGYDKEAEYKRKMEALLGD